MGTNYYLMKNVCPHCGTAEDTIHIGKSSKGWYFSLSVDTYDYHEWMNIFLDKNKIQNEYGDDVTVDEMQDIMHKRKGNITKNEPEQHCVIGINNLVYYKGNKIHPLYPIQFVKGEFS